MLGLDTGITIPYAGHITIMIWIILILCLHDITTVIQLISHLHLKGKKYSRYVFWFLDIT